MKDQYGGGRDQLTIGRQRVAGAALLNPSFRARLQAEPEAAIKSLGLDLADDQVDELVQLARDVDWDAVDALSPLVKAALPRVPQQVAAWG